MAYKNPLELANAITPNEDYFGGIVPPDVGAYKFSDNQIIVGPHPFKRITRSDFLKNYIQEIQNKAKRSVNSYFGGTSPLKQYQSEKRGETYWDEFDSPLARKYNSQWNPDLVKIADEINKYEKSIVDSLGKYTKWNGKVWDE